MQEQWPTELSYEIRCRLSTTRISSPQNLRTWDWEGNLVWPNIHTAVMGLVHTLHKSRETPEGHFKRANCRVTYLSEWCRQPIQTPFMTTGCMDNINRASAHLILICNYLNFLHVQRRIGIEKCWNNCSVYILYVYSLLVLKVSFSWMEVNKTDRHHN